MNISEYHAFAVHLFRLLLSEWLCAKHEAVLQVATGRKVGTTDPPNWTTPYAAARGRRRNRGGGFEGAIRAGAPTSISRSLVCTTTRRSIGTTAAAHRVSELRTKLSGLSSIAEEDDFLLMPLMDMQLEFSPR